MKFTTSFIFFLSLSPAVFMSNLLAPAAAMANDIDMFHPNITVSDGKAGRPWRRWEKRIQSRAVEKVKVVLTRTSGGNDTFVNLRFGDGQTFENGKREYLRSGTKEEVSWNVGRKKAQGLPLVLNAYNGEVYVEEVAVFYEGHTARPPADDFRNKYQDPKPPRHDQPRPGDDKAAMRDSCRNMRVRSPRIDVGKVRTTGGLFSGKYKLEGSIRGMCIEEAGYFERGRLKEEIPFPLKDYFAREEFTVKVRTGRRGEIRVTTFDGREDSIDVDEEIKDYQR